MGLSTLLLLGAALAATPKDARATFDRYAELWESYDLAVLDLYADDATIRVDRDGRVMELSSTQWTALVERVMDAAKEVEDVSTYSRVRVKAEGEGYVVTAHRWSTSKCVMDKTFRLRLEPRGDALRIVEEFSTSPGLSSCTPEPELAALLEQTRAAHVAQLPMMLDEETQLYAVDVVGSTFILHMRFVAMDVDDFDMAAARSILTQTAVRDVCVGRARPLSEAGATVRFSYSTRDGVVLAPIDVSPAVCASLVE